MTTNPWLTIPLDDYEGHMDLPQVGQLAFLRQTLKTALQQRQPASLLYLGAASGNGLEAVDPEVTRRVMAVDINPDYLQAARNRYAASLPQLQTLAVDLQGDTSSLQGQYDLIFAGLLFEYLPPADLLEKVVTWLSPSGRLLVVLQEENPELAEVSPSPFTCLQHLGSIMQLVPEAEFAELAKKAGLRELQGEKKTLDSGKCFYIGQWGRAENIQN
ncbi:class I SAM-dependent methyltransferase [Marinospirillum perlucidum]|uniref:class I SAM-dependent methyltransferase n=1 Tax=Marinospirillum perlucidum TaxID=1982602 RepID=UPI000DF468C5|nr:class I SAM-dependent methyltransferase [Marinospirillum perlucidum]